MNQRELQGITKSTMTYTYADMGRPCIISITILLLSSVFACGFPHISEKKVKWTLSSTQLQRIHIRTEKIPKIFNAIDTISQTNGGRGQKNFTFLNVRVEFNKAIFNANWRSVSAQLKEYERNSFISIMYTSKREGGIEFKRPEYAQRRLHYSRSCIFL